MEVHSCLSVSDGPRLLRAWCEYRFPLDYFVVDFVHRSHTRSITDMGEGEHGLAAIPIQVLTVT